jgi:uncharacterized membrane protein
MSRDITQAQRDWLEAELASWQSLALVSPEQAQSLLGLYESRQSVEARQENKGLFTLLSLAATFVGLGVLLLIGYNWQQMPAALKVVLVFGALIGTHAAAFRLRFRLGWLQLSEVLFFTGCLLFGAAIWLLAQIFQIESTNYDAFWWWAIGTLPFALLLDTVLLHLLFASLLALWVGFDVLSLQRLIWGIPSAGYSLPILAAPGLWWAYRKSSATTVAIYVPLLAWWVVLQPIAWKLTSNPTYYIGAVGSLMLLAASLHPRRSVMAIPFRFYGVVLVAGTLVPLSFHWVNDEFTRDFSTAAFAGIEQMILIFVLAAAMIVAAYFLQPTSPGGTSAPLASLGESLHNVLVRHSISFVFLALFAFLAVFSPAAHDVWLTTIAANIAMVAISLWLIRFGLTEDRGRPFTAGVVYLLFWAVLRYVDLFGAFGGMLGASLMFFLCGGALMGVALYWRNRKAVYLG